MNKYKKLVKNIFIFAIGNAGSKIIILLLVPIYTHYLSTSEYGTMDLVTVTLQILLPIVSFSIYEAVLRFSMDSALNKTALLQSSIGFSILSFSLFAILYIIFFGNVGIQPIYLYILPILFLQMIFQILSQFTRGIGKSKEFVISGLINTFLSGSLSVLLITVLNMSVDGYFIALAIAFFSSILYLININSNLVVLNPISLDSNLLKDLLKYSLPLIPNTLMWWAINSSSRVFITSSLGISYNGLFAVASKLPAVINLISQIFIQAYQLSAFEEHETSSDNKFSSNLFNIYSTVLIFGASLLFIFLKYIFGFVFSIQYLEAWKSVPFLTLGAVFSALSSYLGVAYTSSKNTKGVLTTSIVGGMISLFLNWFLIPRIGLIGAGISSALSFYIMFIIRVYDTKELIKINYNWKRIYFNVFILLIQIYFMYYFDIKYSSITNIILFLILLYFNRNILTLFFSFIKK